MHRLGVVGVSWRHGSAPDLAGLTIPRDERPTRLVELARAAGLRELVYLATCNRVEVIFASDDGTPIVPLRRLLFAALASPGAATREPDHRLRMWQGEGAVEHLFLVTAGLDSARLGEQEIATQVREAVDASRRLGLLSPRLDRVFTEALRLARRVRSVPEHHGGKVSLADIAVRHVLDRVDRTPGRVATVGISPMTDQCARALTHRGVPVVIVNRTLSRATSFAGELGAEACALDDFRANPRAVEAVILATGSPDPVFDRADLERIAARTLSGESPLIVDFAVPPNVTPEDAAAADVPRIGMSQIVEEAARDRERRLGEFAAARAMVDDAVTDLRRQVAERMVGSVVAQLRVRYRETALEGVERLLRHDLAGLGEPEREAVRRWAETLARRFAHVPSAGLRDLSFELGPAAIEAFFRSTDPELARDALAAADAGGDQFHVAPSEQE